MSIKLMKLVTLNLLKKNFPREMTDKVEGKFSLDLPQRSSE